MKIAVLNECFLSDDNLSYLKSLGDVETFNDTTDETKAITRMAGKDIILADMYECPLNASVLTKANTLRLLCINSTGFDLVDLEAAKASKIAIANTSGFSTEAVAEHTFALLLAANRHIIDASLAAKLSPFQINPADHSHYKYLGFTLAGKTIGIIGLGAIGSHVAKIALGFGMSVIGYNRSAKIVENVEHVSLDILFARSDIISLHTPLNEKSKGLINTTSIGQMKKDVVIINTARGGCVISEDLAAALNNRKIAAAGLDDLDIWSTDNPLLKTANVIVTPHSAWFTQQALNKIGDIMTDNVRAFVEGTPRNIIST